MKLPPNFQFSQGSLQDYVECPRRFQLRYIYRLAWPAVESEPALENEQFLQQGARFHRLVQQHLLGVPAPRLERMIQDIELSAWWDSYLAYGWKLPGLRLVSSPTEDAGPASLRMPEISLSAPLDRYRLVAKYDALVWAEGSPEPRLVIVDWKTSRKRTRRETLAARLQTRIYPYLLVRAGNALNQGQAVQPAQVQMVYWFAAFPDQPECFPYSLELFERDQAYLLQLLGEIEALGEVEFPLSNKEEGCRLCTYRSLCARGVRAGCPDEQDIDEIELDFDAIEPVGEL